MHTCYVVMRFPFSFLSDDVVQTKILILLIYEKYETSFFSTLDKLIKS